MRIVPHAAAPPSAPGARPSSDADQRPREVHLPEALSGLHPATPHPCPRCGTPTAALANGRGRLDICQKCGTFEMATHEGLELFSLRDMALPTMRRAR